MLRSYNETDCAAVLFDCAAVLFECVSSFQSGDITPGPFDDWGGGRGCNKFVPVLGGDGTKIVPTGDTFDQPPGGISFIRGKLADHVGDYLVLSPEGAVLVTSPGTESSYSPLSQSLNNSPVSLLLAPSIIMDISSTEVMSSDSET